MNNEELIKIIPVLTFALTLFLALISTVTLKISKLKQLNSYILLPCILVGLFFYGVGYIPEKVAFTSFLNSSIRTVSSVFMMFLGRNDYSYIVKTSPWIEKNIWASILFWFVHLASQFLTISSALSIFGKRLIQMLSIVLNNSKVIFVIFGTNKDAIKLGKELSKKQRRLIIFVTNGNDFQMEEEIISFGGILVLEEFDTRRNLSKNFYNKIKLSKTSKKMFGFFMMLDNDLENFNISKQIIEKSYQSCIPSENLKLFLNTFSDILINHISKFQENLKSTYSIDSFNKAELSARLLIKTIPPCKKIKFDNKGKAVSDFKALIIGFGNVGQNVLRQVLMNSQFYGSNFSAVVIDRNINNIIGDFNNSYPELKNKYNLDFLEYDIKSNEFFEFLLKEKYVINYYVICLGEDNLNNSTSISIEKFLKRNMIDNEFYNISICNRQSIVVSENYEPLSLCFPKSVLVEEIIVQSELDLMGFAVNAAYWKCKDIDVDMVSSWYNSKQIDRDSSKASADFINSILYTIGLSYSYDYNEEDLVTEDEFKKIVSGEILENLSRTEHLRWNAFHFARGYSCISKAKLIDRFEQGIENPRKDSSSLCHALLVDWDELDILSKIQSKYLNDNSDFKQMDRSNILNIPKSLDMHPKKPKIIKN